MYSGKAMYSPPEKRYSSQPELTGDNGNNTQVTTRKRKPNPESQDLISFQREIGDILDKFKITQENQTKKLQESVDELRAQNKEILKSNSNIEKILLHTTTLYEDLKQKYDNLTVGHNEALLKIGALEDQIEDIQRNQRVTTLEIRNIPEGENENLEEILEKIHSSLEVPVSTEHVKQIRRIKSSHNKIIVVEYSNLRTCSSVMKGLKAYNKAHNEDKFNTKCLDFPGEKRPIFIGESLTPAARKLHYLARGLRKDHGYQHCWTLMGRVFVRFAEGTSIIHIKSAQQVEMLKGSPMAEK